MQRSLSFRLREFEDVTQQSLLCGGEFLLATFEDRAGRFDTGGEVDLVVQHTVPDATERGDVLR